MASEETRIQIASDPDHENVCAEIYVADKFVALLSHEPNSEQRLEFPGVGQDEALLQRTVALDVFLRAVEQAREALLGCSPGA